MRSAHGDSVDRHGPSAKALPGGTPPRHHCFGVSAGRVDEPAERRRSCVCCASEAESLSFSARAAHGGTPFHAADAYAGAAHSKRLVRLVELADASAEDALGAAAWLAHECATDALRARAADRRVRSARRLPAGRDAAGSSASCAASAAGARPSPAKGLARCLPSRATRRRGSARPIRRPARASEPLGPRAAGRADPGRRRGQLPGPRLRRSGRAHAWRRCRSRAVASGAAIFQAILATARPYTTAERAPEFPGLPPLPRAGTLGGRVGVEPLFAALASGFAERFGLALERAAALHRRAARAGCRRAAAARGPRARRSAQRRSGRDSDRRARGPRRSARRRRARASAPARRLDRRGATTCARSRRRSRARARESRARARCARWLADPKVLAIGVVAPEAIAQAVRLSGA